METPRLPISLQLLLGLMHPEEISLGRERGREGIWSHPEAPDHCLDTEKSAAVIEALCFLSL